jgi:hypothetical protein
MENSQAVYTRHKEQRLENKFEHLLRLYNNGVRLI